MNLMSAIAVFIGGGFGSLARYSIGTLFRNIELTQLPIATLSSNLISCLILGWVAAKVPPHSSLYLLIAVGFCGGFSTFSAFSLETLQLVKSGQIAWAVVNVTASILACLIILFILAKTLK